MQINHKGTAWHITLTEQERRSLADFAIECLDEMDFDPPLKSSEFVILKALAKGLRNDK